MARPVKDGLSYFSFDTDFFLSGDKRIRRLHSRFGNDGTIFFIYLLSEIYRNGYYLRWDQDSVEDAMDVLDLTEGFIEQVMTFLVGRSLLYQSTLANSDTILTSPGIQKRYQEAKKGFKREITVDSEIWLLSEEETASFIKVTNNHSFSEKNPSLSEKNGSKSEKNSTKEIKGNKKKGNEIKEKERKENESISVSNETVCQTDVRLVVDAWNGLSDYGIQPISKITPSSKRYQSLVARIREYNVADVLAAIDKIKNSDFLQGKNKKGWTITFDWFVLPNNFPKVIEGNYNNKSTQSGDDSEWLRSWRDA